jgi:chromosome partitioning protein
MKTRHHATEFPIVIVLASGKGGVGKSTLARSLAGYWLTMGRKPAVVDADPQASITSLHDADGPMGGVVVVSDPEMETIGAAIADLKTRHGIVIVDTAGFRNQTTIAACVAADVVLIPLKAAAEDMREAVAMLNLIGELNATPERRSRPIKAALVLTMVTPGTVIARQVRKELEKAGYPLLDAEVAQRVAFPELSMRGIAPSLVEPDGAAARDIGRLAGELNNLWRNADVQAA